MANYRDDRDALRDKAEVLSSELAGTKAELEEKEAELDQKDAEIARLRKMAGVRAPGTDRWRAVLMGSATVGAVLIGSVVAVTTMRSKPAPAPPAPAERQSAVVPPRDSAIPGPLHRAHFLARVVKVVGRNDVTIDQLCNVWASAHGLGIEQKWRELVVECDGVELYRRSNDAGRIVSFTAGTLTPNNGDESGASGYTLHYEETGARTSDSRPHIALESALEHGRIFSDGAVRTEVSFKLDKVGTKP